MAEKDIAPKGSERLDRPATWFSRRLRHPWIYCPSTRW